MQMQHGGRVPEGRPDKTGGRGKRMRPPPELVFGGRIYREPVRYQHQRKRTIPKTFCRSS